jgi:erythromycin esterase
MKNAWLVFLLLVAVACQNDEFKASRATARNEALKNSIEPLANAEDLTPLLNEIGESRFVLLGASSHGTSEFYRWRLELTRRLIAEKGFSIIAVEGEWPSMYLFNHYINATSDTLSSAAEALTAAPWPHWLWLNREISEFGEWLRNHNYAQPEKVQLYGIDIYSLWTSLDELNNEVKSMDPEIAQRISEAYSCLRQYYRDELQYSISTLNDKADCSDGASAAFNVLMQEWISRDDLGQGVFNALQNARVVKNAERYYYASMRSATAAWNIRDSQMMEMLDGILKYHGPKRKVIIWAHNTHVVNPRATSLSSEGMINFASLLRDRYSTEGVYAVGFGSYSGTVTASTRWNGETQFTNLPPARPGSWEEVLQRYEPSNKIVMLNRLKGDGGFVSALAHRAVGVIYDGVDEEKNYLPAIVPDAYDAFVYIERTTALQPLRPDGVREKTAMLRSRRGVE